MALTAAQIQAEIDAIDQSLAQPEEVRLTDRSMRLRNVADLLKAREALSNALAQLNNTVVTRQYRPYTGKGWDD